MDFEQVLDSELVRHISYETELQQVISVSNDFVAFLVCSQTLKKRLHKYVK